MSLSAGTRLGPYEILALIGAGGMGEVYKARDTRLNRLVALKVLPADRMADPERRRRFVQEAQLASSLQHPNIVTIYDITSEGGLDAIAMELVRGRPLDEVIPRKGLRLGEALKYAVQIADALAAAHAAGIVHRDLKPGNIMIGEQGVVKVLDFGLAKLTDAAPISELDETRTEGAKTQDGTILGSVAYMSPEQAEGKHLDARSDIFSFGAVLYEMLTGQRAFQGDSKISTLAAVLKQEPRPVSQVVEGVPPEMDRWIARCLRKDVTKRAQHMADIKLALDELKEDSESGSLEAAAAAGAKRTPRRLWPMAAIAAGVAVLAMAAWWWRSSPQETSFEVSPLTTYPGSESAPSFSPDGSQVAFHWLGEGQSAPNIYLKLIGGGPPLRLTADDGAHFAPAWSPDGKWIAYFATHADGRQGIFLIPPLGGPERLLVEGAVGFNTSLDASQRIDWSPDNKWIAYGRGQVTLVSVDTGERREFAKLNPAVGYNSRHPAISPDGHRLAYVSGPGNFQSEIYVVELSADMKPQGQPKRITFGDRNGELPVWTADGREIVFMQGTMRSDGAIARVAPDGKGLSRRIPGLGYTSGPIAIARNGRRLAFSRGGVDSNIWRLDLSGREAPRKLVASTLVDMAGEYSPDGKRIVFSSNRSGPGEIWVCDADGNNAVQLTHIGGPVTGTARWSPDGRRIAFDSRPGNNADIYVIQAEGGAPRRLTDQPGEDARPAWSADGKWIYFCSDRSGRQEIWRMTAEGGSAAQITKNGGISVIAAKDGEWLYYCFRQQLGGGGGGTIRKIRTDGSNDSEAIPLRVPFLEYTATPTGVYFVVIGRENSTLQLLRFATGKIVELMKLDYPPYLGLSVSPDERYVLVTKPDQNGTDLMLVENFR